MSHEKAEQIRARIVCTPAESAWRAWIQCIRRWDEEISIIYTSSVSLRLTPSPTGEGWRNAELFSGEVYLDEFDSLSSNGEVQECVENLAGKLGKPSPVGEGGAVNRDG